MSLAQLALDSGMNNGMKADMRLLGVTGTQQARASHAHCQTEVREKPRRPNASRPWNI